jgi:hypothetical protein
MTQSQDQSDSERKRFPRIPTSRLIERGGPESSSPCAPCDATAPSEQIHSAQRVNSSALWPPATSTLHRCGPRRQSPLSAVAPGDEPIGVVGHSAAGGLSSWATAASGPPRRGPPVPGPDESPVTLWSHEDPFASDVPNVTVSPRRVALSVRMAVGNRSSRMRGHMAAQAGTQERKGRRVLVNGPPSVIP